MKTYCVLMDPAKIYIQKGWSRVYKNKDEFKYIQNQKIVENMSKKY